MFESRHTQELELGLSSVKFLPGMDLQQYLDDCKCHHPTLYKCLDVQRQSLDRLRAVYNNLDSLCTHFEGKEQGGRGDAYRVVQKRNPVIRGCGINKLFDLVTPSGKSLSPSLLILDVLGGNGTLTRAIRHLREPQNQPTIFTSDISAAMIQDALTQRLPAVRQPAQNLLFGDATVDGVIFAYGTHHIPVPDREQSLAEAWRVLRPGGRVVVQDFEEGTVTARWYSEVLDSYTLTGHKFEHFTQTGMYDLLTSVGFKNVEVHQVYDPCIVYESTFEEARICLLDYLISLFALEKLLPQDGKKDKIFWDRAEEIVRMYSTFTKDQLPSPAEVTAFTIVKAGEFYRAELPRVALVAVGER